MKSIFNNITYLRKKERKSTLLLVFIIVFSSFTDNIYLGLKILIENNKKVEVSLNPSNFEENKSPAMIPLSDNNLPLKEEQVENKKDTDKNQNTELLPTKFTKKANSNPDSENSLSSGSNPDSAFTIGINHDLKPTAKLNPNTANKEILVSYGISEFAASNLIKYKNAGGTFKIKADLLKIYGIDSAQFHQLKPLIDLPEKITQKTFTKENRYQKTEINSALASDFQQFSGIGEVLSNRILKYREKLGGFYKIEQLNEVYGIQDSILQQHSEYLYVEKNLRKININSATEWELSQHPYISSKVAKIITNFRTQNGQYFNKEDLLKIAIIDEEWIEKIAPYLDY